MQSVPYTTILHLSVLLILISSILKYSSSSIGGPPTDKLVGHFMRSLCVIPVYNQVREIKSLLESCQREASCTEILIVDDGSDDGSTEVISKSGFKVIRSPIRMGLGHALIQGAKVALEKDFEIILHMAGNGKMLPSEMSRVLDPILRNEADMVYGSRFLPGGNFPNAPLFRRYAIPLVANQVASLSCGKQVSDATCGYRAYRSSILTHFLTDWDHPSLYGYGYESYLMCSVLKSNLRTLEVPISMMYPKEKKSYSKLTPFISWWDTLYPWIYVGLKSVKFAELPEPVLSQIDRIKPKRAP